MNLRTRWIHHVSRALTILMFLCLIVFFYKNLQKIDWASLNFPWYGAAIMLVCMLFFHLLCSLSLVAIQRDLAIPMSLYESSKLYFQSLLAAYIPGKIFVVAKRKILLHERGVPLSKITVIYFLENIVTLLGACVFIAVMFFEVVRRFDPHFQVYLGLFILAMIVAVHPRLVEFALSIYQKIFNKGSHDHVKGAHYGTLLLSVFLNGLAWVSLSLGYFSLVQDMVPEVAWSDYREIAASLAVAGIAGMVAVFAPSGLGVREGFVVFSLQHFMSLEKAALLAILMRLFTTLGDIFTVGFLSLVDTLVKKKGQQTDEKPVELLAPSAK